MMILTTTCYYKICLFQGPNHTIRHVSVRSPNVNVQSIFFMCNWTQLFTWQEPQPHVSIPFHLCCWGRYVSCSVRSVPLYRCMNSFVFPWCNRPSRASAALFLYISYKSKHTHTHTHLVVGLLWTCDQLVAEASLPAQHTTNIRDEHRCSQRN